MSIAKNNNDKSDSFLNQNRELILSNKRKKKFFTNPRCKLSKDYDRNDEKYESNLSM